MRLDYRRFNGPENSVSYKHFLKDRPKSTDILHQELLSENRLRKDGRALDEARIFSTFFGRTEVTTQAKGSAYIEMGRTKLICTVFDPREIDKRSEFGQLFVEVKFAPFSCPRKRRDVPDEEEKSLSADLKKALNPAVCRDRFPNSQIDIFVYILEHDGSCLAAAINAAGMACVDAVMPMYDVITACSVAVIGDDVFVDPTEAEEFVALKSLKEDTNHGTVTLSMLHTLKKITNFRVTGAIDMACVTNVMDTLEKECTKIVPKIKQIFASIVVKNIEKDKAADKESQKWQELFGDQLLGWRNIINP